MLTGLKLSLGFLLLFLNTGVIFAFFQGGWKISFFDRIKKNVSKYIRILFNNFCQIISTLACFRSFQCQNFHKDFFSSFGFLLHTSPIESILGWFLYFTIHFKTRSLILLARGSQFEYSAISRLLTTLEKKVLLQHYCYPQQSPLYLLMSFCLLILLYLIKISDNSFLKCFVITDIFLIKISEIVRFKFSQK